MTDGHAGFASATAKRRDLARGERNLEDEARGGGWRGAASVKYNKQSAGSIIRPAGKIYVGRLREHQDVVESA